MWLLDHNLPVQVHEVLNTTLKVTSETARNKQWDTLENGELVKVAVASGFVCILTRDVRFRDSAAKTLRNYPQFSIVLVTLKQQPGLSYAKEFLSEWKVNPIVPAPGQLIVWPKR